MGFPLRSPYAASKWAIVGLTKTLAMELGKFKIRVNAICPGTIKGDRMKRVVRDKAKFLKTPQSMIEKEFVSMASMNSWIYEDDIGKMCAFLISNDSERVVVLIWTCSIKYSCVDCENLYLSSVSK